MQSNKNVLPNSEILQGSRKRITKKIFRQFQDSGMCLVIEVGIKTCQHNGNDNHELDTHSYV